MKKKQVLAYCLTKNLHLMTEEDIKILDAIHIAFGLIKNGEVYWVRKNTTKELARIKAINPNIKLILSVGGWAADGFSQAAYTKEGREKFAESAIALLKEENLDGLDMDWEYPCIGDGGIQALPEDKENFTLLLAELRKQLDECDSYKSLSIAAGGLESYINATNMGEVQKYLDYVQLMTYDFHCGFSKITGHLANLYGSKAEPDAPNADHTIGLFVDAGVPIEKIVMGAAFYGRVWRGVPNINNGLGQMTEVENGDDSKGYAELVDIVATKKNGFERFWDEDAKAAYLFNGKIFISFEDEEALSYKIDYVKDKNMYGVMYWEYAQDESYTLTKFLHDGLMN